MDGSIIAATGGAALIRSDEREERLSWRCRVTRVMGEKEKGTESR